MGLFDRGVQMLLTTVGAFAAFSLMTIAVGTDYWLYSRGVCKTKTVSENETSKKNEEVMTHSGLWRTCCLEGIWFWISNPPYLPYFPIPLPHALSLPPNKSLCIPPFSHFIPFTTIESGGLSYSGHGGKKTGKLFFALFPSPFLFLTLPHTPSPKIHFPPPMGMMRVLQKHKETLSERNRVVCLSSDCLYCLGKQCQNAVLLLCSGCNHRVKSFVSLQTAYLQRQDWEWEAMWWEGDCKAIRMQLLVHFRREKERNGNNPVMSKMPHMVNLTIPVISSRVQSIS